MNASESRDLITSDHLEIMLAYRDIFLEQFSQARRFQCQPEADIARVGYDATRRWIGKYLSNRANLDNYNEIAVLCQHLAAFLIMCK